MKTLLATLAALTLSLASASACAMHQASTVDQMTTASLETDKPMSTRADAVTGEAENATMEGTAQSDQLESPDQD